MSIKLTIQKNMYAFLRLECIIPVMVCRRKSAPGEAVVWKSDARESSHFPFVLFPSVSMI